MTKHIITAIVFVIVVALAFVFFKDTNTDDNNQKDLTRTEKTQDAQEDADLPCFATITADGEKLEKADQNHQDLPCFETIVAQDTQKPLALSTEKTTNSAIAEANKKELEKADTSQTSLDWEGKYKGILPCASCSGIETKVELFAENKFTITEKYLGKDFVVEDSGDFIWLEGGSDIILLMKKSQEEKTFKVIENGLALLNLEGKMVEKDGQWDKDYILTRVEE